VIPSLLGPKSVRPTFPDEMIQVSRNEIHAVHIFDGEGDLLLNFPSSTREREPQHDYGSNGIAALEDSRQSMKIKTVKVIRLDLFVEFQHRKIKNNETISQFIDSVERISTTS
jgi:hypothetical protein